MKKSIFFPYIFVFMLSAPSLLAQPDWQWGQEVRFNAQSIAVDNEGNSYVTWSLQDTYEIDDELFISNGQSDVALTSFDCDGAHRWTKTIGGQSVDVSTAIRTDTLGGVYLVGRINAMGNFDVNVSNDTIISGYTNKAFFLTKYNTEGDFQWFRMPEDTVVIDINNLQFAVALDMDVAPNGDCYLYSKLPQSTYGNGAFEAPYEGTANSGADIYALKYDSDGNCTGGVHLDIWHSGGLLQSSDFMRDPYTGKFYLSGYNSNDDDTLIFGGEQVTAENYVVQFDPSGFVNWSVSTTDVGIGPTGFVGKPKVDPLGNVYLTGFSYNNNTLGDFTFLNTLDNNGFSIFAKIDSMGNVVYVTNASSFNDNYSEGVAWTDSKIGVSGNYVGTLIWGDAESTSEENSQGFDFYLALFDPSGDGPPESFHSLTSSPLGVERPSLLTTDNQGNFYVGGNFSGQLHVGDGTLYNQSGSQEGFIAKFGSDSCYCPLPEALFTYDSILNQAEYAFVYTGSTDVDSVVWDFGDGNVGYGINQQHLFAETGTYTVCATAYNSCGPDSVCITIDALGPVGVRAINGFENIKLYPNPAQAMLTIGNATPGTRLAVINAMGQQLQSAVLLSTPSQLDISKLPPGVYLLQLTDGNERIGYARFVKE